MCTRLTAILSIAILLAIWPPTWNRARGAVVVMIALVGNRRPPERPGIVRNGVTRASRDNTMHHDETNENCMSVSVMGCGKELRIVLEEVFDSAEVRYLHRTLATWSTPNHSGNKRRYTISNTVSMHPTTQVRHQGRPHQPLAYSQ